MKSNIPHDFQQICRRGAELIENEMLVPHWEPAVLTAAGPQKRSQDGGWPSSLCC